MSQRSIDMEIRINHHPGLLYVRLSAGSEQALQEKVHELSEKWGSAGVWVEGVFYPAHVINSVATFSPSSFAEEARSERQKA